MKTKVSSFRNQSHAREAAHAAYERNVKDHGEELCKIEYETNGIVVTRPDLFEGMLRVHYKW